jgi:hypothetical protein
MQFLISGKGPDINIVVDTIVDSYLAINCDDFEFSVKLGVLRRLFSMLLPGPFRTESRNVGPIFYLITSINQGSESKIFIDYVKILS